MAGALPVAAVNGRVFTSELGRVVDGERQIVAGDGGLLGAGHDEQTSAQGDAVRPLSGFNLHVPRLHGLGEVRLDVRVVSDVVLEHLAAVDVIERAALKVRDLHLELRHLLGAVSATLRHDTGDVHDSTGIHGVCLTSGVARGEPAMLTVEHAGVIAVAGNVVAVRARRVTSVVGGVKHLGQRRQRRHAIAGLNLLRQRITTEGLDRARNVLAACGLGVSALEHRLERRLVGRRSRRGRLAEVNLTARAGAFASLLRARIRRRRLAHVLQARAQGDAPRERHHLDAHEARRDGLGEHRLTLLLAFQVRGTDVRRAVGDVREGPVGVLTRQHLEFRHHLVVAAATLGHDGRDGANFAGVDGEVLAGGVSAREPSCTAVEHAREVAVARLVIV